MQFLSRKFLFSYIVRLLEVVSEVPYIAEWRTQEAFAIQYSWKVWNGINMLGNETPLCMSQ